MRRIDTKIVQTLFQNGICSTRFLADRLLLGPEWEQNDKRKMASIRAALNRLLGAGRVRKVTSSTWTLTSPNDEF